MDKVLLDDGITYTVPENKRDVVTLKRRINNVLEISGTEEFRLLKWEPGCPMGLIEECVSHDWLPVRVVDMTPEVLLSEKDGRWITLEIFLLVDFMVKMDKEIAGVNN